MRRLGWFAVFSMLLAPGACGGSEDEGAGEKCASGEVRCTADAYTLESCEGGTWKKTECMRDEGKLCEVNECVLPWRYGSPSFDQCADEPRATSQSLREKADYYESLVRRLHIHPKLGWLNNARLKDGAVEATATYDDVEDWDSGENDGLWSALYLGAEAYRWAATKDPAALETIELMVASEEKRMRITGTPGLFTRQMIPPGVPGIACPTDLSRYVADTNKDNNRWVMIGPTGCIETTDATTLAWKTSSVCGLEEFIGWCFYDNISQDEYAGHMFALAALAKLVDIPSVQAPVKKMLAQIGDHLIENKLKFRDWDGRITEHGSIFPGKLVAGYHAAMTLSFMKTIALATGDQKYATFYDECMLQRNGEKDCFEDPAYNDKPYDEFLTPTGLNLGCKANWNNYSMYMLSLHGLIWGEREPELREKVQDALQNEMWTPPDEPRPLSEQNNSWFDFIYAAGKKLGPDDPPAQAAVENGICMLRQFPANKVEPDITCPPEKCIEVCKDRFGNPMTDYPRPVAERCLGRFSWWGTPYSTAGCTANPKFVTSPGDYLVAYWMGRYYGFIDPNS